MALRDGAVRLITCVSYTNYAIISRSFVDAPFHCRRPRVPCSFCVDMEQFTIRRHVVVTIAVNVQGSPQDSSVHSKLLPKLRLRMTIF